MMTIQFTNGKIIDISNYNNYIFFISDMLDEITTENSYKYTCENLEKLHKNSRESHIITIVKPILSLLNAKEKETFLNWYANEGQFMQPTVATHINKLSVISSVLTQFYKTL